MTPFSNDFPSEIFLHIISFLAHDSATLCLLRLTNKYIYQEAERWLWRHVRLLSTSGRSSEVFRRRLEAVLDTRVNPRRHSYVQHITVDIGFKHFHRPQTEVVREAMSALIAGARNLRTLHFRDMTDSLKWPVDLAAAVFFTLPGRKPIFQLEELIVQVKHLAELGAFTRFLQSQRKIRRLGVWQNRRPPSIREIDSRARIPGHVLQGLDAFSMSNDGHFDLSLTPELKYLSVFAPKAILSSGLTPMMPLVALTLHWTDRFDLDDIVNLLGSSAPALRFLGMVTTIAQADSYGYHLIFSDPHPLIKLPQLRSLQIEFACLQAGTDTFVTGSSDSHIRLQRHQKNWRPHQWAGEGLRDVLVRIRGKESAPAPAMDVHPNSGVTWPMRSAPDNGVWVVRVLRWARPGGSETMWTHSTDLYTEGRTSPRKDDVPGVVCDYSFLRLWDSRSLVV